MDKADRDLLDALIDTHRAKTHADREWSEASERAWNAVQNRLGPVYYKGHLIELQGMKLTVREIRSVPAEV